MLEALSYCINIPSHNLPMGPDIPANYKAAVFESKDSKLTTKEIPLEYPKHGEILIKVLACGVCYSDVEVQKGNFGNDLLVSIFLLSILIFLRDSIHLTHSNLPVLLSRDMRSLATSSHCALERLILQLATESEVHGTEDTMVCILNCESRLLPLLTGF